MFLFKGFIAAQLNPAPGTTESVLIRRQIHPKESPREKREETHIP